MQRKGYDPVEELVDIAQSNISLDLRCEIAKTLAPYMYPKLNAVTITREDDSAFVESNVNMLNLVMQSPDLTAAAQTIGVAQANEHVKQLTAAKMKGLEQDNDSE
jgi:hypothetical protein